MEIVNEIISTVILPLQLVQEGNYRQKHVHKVLVNYLNRGLDLPKKSVSRLTDCFDMTLTVLTGQQTQTQINKIFGLTLKMPRKLASENVICLCPLLNILANFPNLFLHTGAV